MSKQYIRLKNIYIYAFSFVFMLRANAAMAAYGWGTTPAFGMCVFAQAFSGQIAAALATIAICTLGAMACVGRIQWTTAIVVATGVAAMFGAGAIINLFTGLTGVGVSGNTDCESSAYIWSP